MEKSRKGMSMGLERCGGDERQLIAYTRKNGTKRESRNIVVTRFAITEVYEIVWVL